MKIGYMRVSTLDQEAGYEEQRRRLTEAGCERIFEEKITGTKMDRPQLALAIDFLRAGDLFVGTKVDRIGRNMKDILQIDEDVTNRGAGLLILDMSVDTSTAAGKFMLHMMAAAAEFEVCSMRERQRIGIEKAKREGKYAKTHYGWKKPDRKPQSPQNLELAQYIAPVIRYARMVKPSGGRLFSYDDIAVKVGCARSTVHKILSQAGMVKSRAPRADKMQEAAE